MGVKLAYTSNVATSILTIFLIFVIDSTPAQFQTRNSTALNLKIIRSNVNITQPQLAQSINGTQTQRACECMEYWSCAIKKGQIYSYCGLSDSQVCCFLNDPLPPVKNTTTLLRNATITSSVPTSVNPGKPSDSKALLPNATTSPLLNSAVKRRRTSSKCGVPSIKGNVDSVAVFKEWPWHVAILEAKDDLYICGGSLISSNAVLTAAHCISPYVKDKKNQRLKIRAGEYDVSSNSESVPHIEGMTLHPNFTSALENDIAVLTLVRTIPEIETRGNIAPICLPTPKPTSKTAEILSSNLTSKTCVVTGWGRPSENADHSVILKEVIVPLWEHGECEGKLQRHFGPDYKLPPNTLCAGSEGNDACDGDGGGPLVCFQNGTWIQEGIVSFGIGCGRAASPGVYTKVASHMGFLKPFL